MPSHHHSIFADPQGRRRRFAQITILLAALTFLGASAYFISSLLIAPQLHLPQEVRVYRTPLKAKSAHEPSLLELKNDWHHLLLPLEPFSFHGSNMNGTTMAFISNITTPPHITSTYHPTGHTPFPIRLGYAVDYDAQSLSSLKRHSSLLTHVASDWFNLIGVEGKLVEAPNEDVRSLCLHKALGFLPTLRNIDDNAWQPEAIEGFLKISAEERSLFIKQLIHHLPAGSIGLLLDWNNLDPQYRAEIAQFITEIGNLLHEYHYELWINIPTGKAQEVYDLEIISKVADHLVATLYDENSEPDEPGPLAEQDWLEQELQKMLAFGKPEQWVAGLGVYGIDWNETKESIQTLSFADMMARASLANAEHITVEEPHFSPSFHYLSGLNGTEEHEAWFSDAITFFNQLRTLIPYHLGGIAIDRLGQEDPGIWKALQLNTALETEGRNQPTTEELEEFQPLTLKHEVASIGIGDFLSLGEEPTEGWRHVTLEPNGFISSTYEDLPAPATIYHQGAPLAHQVALTFDDGPDPLWTPQILKILKAKNVPASFFVLGSQAQQFPDLVQKLEKGGYEIGNHTYTHPNLGESSDEQIYLELNATTRLIESITGHSTSLFRPPYNGDGNPSTPGELRALRIASDLGYLTVGESIDTSDWECPGVEVILNRVKEQRSQGGSVILLHDAGGNRAQTVAALPRIIDYLQSRGDEIVPLSNFIRLSKETLMPPLHKAEVTVAMHYVYGSFAILRFLEMTGWTLLIIITLLSLVCIFFFVFCALCHRSKERKKNQQLSESFFPSLSIIIAAYNEARVIGSTIEHLLNSNYSTPFELIIVDDGSHDNTREIVEKWMINNTSSLHKIILLTQENSGKSTALNRAINQASHEIIVTLDADTMVTSEALQKLIIPLQDPHVGAVSGHIRVGNTRPWLGRFQQIEYEFAFEINRRAQDYLDCITVAPGALSAFRRSALFEVGLLNSETLAEDTDLTLQLHRQGWIITYAPEAIADTEAPESIKALLSQRFRWAFGTLQCLWKHRSLTFSPSSGWLGWLALPSIWVFQLGIIALTPVLDLLVIFSLFFGRGRAIWPYFFISLFLDIGLAALSSHFAKRSAWSAWRALPMRFFYRPLLGYIVWKCFFKAIAGSWVRWKKLERTAAAIKEKEKTEQ